jgi:hypothetical protein
MNEPKSKRVQGSSLCHLDAYSDAELRIPVKPSVGLLGGTGAAVNAAFRVMKNVRCYRRSAIGGQFGRYVSLPRYGE